MSVDPTAIIGGVSSVLGTATQKSSPFSRAESSAGSAMYGNFLTGDFTVGGGGGASLGGLLGTTNTNGLILAAIGAVALAALFLLRKKR